MAPPIRLFLADVDGTLVTQDKILTDRAIAAVAKLREAGILFAITSGRPPRGMSMLIEPLQLTTPIAAFNGGVYVHPDMSVIEQQTIPDDLRGRLAGVELLSYGVGPPAGQLRSGTVASLAGVRVSLVSGGLICTSDEASFHALRGALLQPRPCPT